MFSDIYEICINLAIITTLTTLFLQVTTTEFSSSHCPR